MRLLWSTNSLAEITWKRNVVVPVSYCHRNVSGTSKQSCRGRGLNRLHRCVMGDDGVEALTGH